MSKVKDFCEWFIRLGGYPPPNCEETMKGFFKMHTKLKESSFKLRVKEIKEKYNYKFIGIERNGKIRQERRDDCS
jgi:hypothetical protein